MSTYTQILYQIVFGTKNHRPVLVDHNREELYKYIAGVLKNKKCHLYQIGGVKDHLHIQTHLHPGITLGGMVKDIKLSSIRHIKENNLFPDFDGWQDGYGAFTYNIKEKERLITYIKNQVEHHKVVTYEEEFKALLREHGINFDERYWF